MSIWMFIILLGIGFGVGAIGNGFLGKEGEKTSNGCILTGWIFILGGLSIIGYGFYKCFIFDYSEAIEKAIVKHDFEKAHELLFEMSQESEETKEIYDLWEGKRKKSKYTISLEKVFRAELTYLLNFKDKESSDRLIALIANLPIEATPIVGTTNNEETQEKNEEYSIYAGKINGICDDVLNTAISSNNKYLAEKILLMYKPTLVRDLKESNFFSTNAYTYSYSNEMQIAARKRYEEAVRTGMFNDKTSSQSSNVKY